MKKLFSLLCVLFIACACGEDKLELGRQCNSRGGADSSHQFRYRMCKRVRRIFPIRPLSPQTRTSQMGRCQNWNISVEVNLYITLTLSFLSHPLQRLRRLRPNEVSGEIFKTNIYE